MAKLRLSSVVFCAKFTFTIKSSAMLNIAPAPGGFQRGIAIPLWLLRVRVHRERGRSEHPLPVRVFGDFLRVEKVTLRSIPQSDAAKNHT